MSHNASQRAVLLPRVNTDLQLAARIHRRFLEQGEAAGMAYAVQLVRQMPHLADQLYALMPPTRAQTIRHEVDRQRAAKATLKAQEALSLEEQQAQAHAAEQARLASLSTQLLQARQGGCAVTFLAGLARKDRDRLATREERLAAQALRQTGMLKGKVLTALGCTTAERERWHGDGRLPPLYTRVVPLAVAGKAQACRFWAEEVVTQARESVAQWRLEDERQRRRRTKKVAGHAA